MMNIIMRKPTQFRSRFYSRGKPYPVTDEVGTRWIKKKLAVLDTRPEMLDEPEKPVAGDLEEFTAPGNSLADELDIVPDETPENNGNPNIKELRLMAKAAKITGYSRMSKKELMGTLNGDNNTR